jgi:hypothetical protein
MASKDAQRTLDQIAHALGLPPGTLPADVLSALQRTIEAITKEGPADAAAESPDPPPESPALLRALNAMTPAQLSAYRALRATRSSAKPRGCR